MTDQTTTGVPDEAPDTTATKPTTPPAAVKPKAAAPLPDTRGDTKLPDLSKLSDEQKAILFHEIAKYFGGYGLVPVVHVG